jgi:uncharacterized protein Usg
MRDQLATGLAEDALVPRFQAYMETLLAGHGLTEDAIRDYEIADPAFMSVHGLARYWRKKAAGALAP